jgi:hypothetical protein
MLAERQAAGIVGEGCSQSRCCRDVMDTSTMQPVILSVKLEWSVRAKPSGNVDSSGNGNANGNGFIRAPGATTS